jgi:virginiamycin B lyase
LLGRINSADGSMCEFALPAGAKPHSVNIDRAGNARYTGNKNGTIGKLNSNTSKITVYPMSDSAARDPHTAVFDAAGILWFTLQHSNMIGRLDPASGDVRQVTMKTSGARPYGIKIDARACCGSRAMAAIAWCGLLRTAWNSLKSVCPTMRPPCVVSISPATA